MLRGLYTAAAGMNAIQLGMDTTANNLANVSTNGFKRSQVQYQAFPEMLMSRMSAQGETAVGGMATGSKVRSTAFDWHQGAIMETGNDLDCGLEGEGFFTVKDAFGNTYYTRNGNFSMDENNQLRTMDGMAVQGELGNVILENGETLKIGQSGLIQTQANRRVDTLVVTQFVNPHSLEKVGNHLYRISASTQIKPPSGPNDAKDYRIFQDTLEGSNTNPVVELVNTISGLRQYESLQKALQTQNQTLEKAVNQVGSVR
jgi:flagellar basal-body rod protein FlgF